MNGFTKRWIQIKERFDLPTDSWLAKGPRFLREKWRSISWGDFFSLKGIANGIEHFVSFLLRLGTLALIVFFILFIVRLFKDQGYVLEAVSVPQHLEEGGYNGQIVALRIQDEVEVLKEIAGSIKDDSLELQGIQEDLNLSVLGVGLSLRSVAYQLRSVFGRQTKTIRAEITTLNEEYEMKLRMTDYPTATLRVGVGEEGEMAALGLLFRQAGEQILGNTDPYRLALVCNNEGRYEEGVRVIRKMLKDRPNEAHWAFLAWGSILKNQTKYKEAGDKFKRSAKANPDFSLAWIQLSQIYERLDQSEEAIQAMRKCVELESENPWRHLNFAWLLHRNEYYDGADSAFTYALSIAEDREIRADISISWAESKLQRDDLAGTLAIIEEYKDDFDDSPMGYITRAIIAIAQQDTAQAFAYALEAIELDPSLPAAISTAINGAFVLEKYPMVIELVGKAELDEVPNWAKQNALNRAAMASNLMGDHDEAFKYVREAIATDTTLAYPYTTLAESFAFTQQMDSCWYYFDKAFAMGYGTDFDEADWALPPYPRLKTMPEFQALLEKYKEEEDEFAN